MWEFYNVGGQERTRKRSRGIKNKNNVLSLLITLANRKSLFMRTDAWLNCDILQQICRWCGNTSIRHTANNKYNNNG